MLQPPARMLFLTGAPSTSSLSWKDTDLSAPLQACFSEQEEANTNSKTAYSSIAPLWRSLPLELSHLPTGLTQVNREHGPFARGSTPTEGTSFFTTHDVSKMSSEAGEEQSQLSQCSISENNEILSQYYEHSFAVHEDIPSSQIIDAGSLVDFCSILEADEPSMYSSIYSDISSQDQIIRSRVTAAYLSDLKDMPNAAYLGSISPQTVTVDLVVGIISIAQPRTIITRKGGRSVDLVEMLVGDSTRSGFGITIWLPSPQETRDSRGEGMDLRSAVAQLRSQDIVLARTVALNSFKGRVYGQSLNRSTTTLDLLYRRVIDADDIRGTYRARDLEVEAVADPKVSKIKRVKDWVMQFVGAQAGHPQQDNAMTTHVKRQPLQMLPSNTP